MALPGAALALALALALLLPLPPARGGAQGASPQVAGLCGKPALRLDLDTGRWAPGPGPAPHCLSSARQALAYCQQAYPELQITSAVEGPEPVTIDNWCRKGRPSCRGHRHTVVPYRCLVGEFVSEALLVPDKCKFLHQEKMDSCESYVAWHGVAKEACGMEGLELHSYGMLLPCGADHFRGVEYVCCPPRPPPGPLDQPSSLLRSPAPLREEPEHSEGTPTGRAPTEEETLETGGKEAEDEDEDEDEGLGEEEEEADDGLGEDEDDPFPDTRDDYFVEPGYYDDSVTQTTITTTTQTTEEEVKVTPTPRPTDGVDIYFEMPGDGSEHANFLRAKMDLEERRMKQINEVMKEWAEADNQAKELPKADRQALNEHFQSILQTLEEQVAGERQRLVETHLARVVALLNDHRRLALEGYLRALQADNPQPERVLQALRRYLRAEQRDQRHTLRHYQHVSAVDPQKAEQMKFQVYTHLHVIEERMNQSLALLDKSPHLSSDLRAQIQELLRAERVGAGTLLTTSISETRTTEELLPLDSSEDPAPEHRLHPPVGGDSSPREGADSQQADKKGLGMVDEDGPSDAALLHQYEQKLNTSARDIKRVAYKPPEIQRDELEPDTLVTINRGALIGLLVVAVAVAMVIVISLLMVRRKPYGTISHGIVEVDPMVSPEERQLSRLQTHGYENPSYKFFEELN